MQANLGKYWHFFNFCGLDIFDFLIFQWLHSKVIFLLHIKFFIICIEHCSKHKNLKCTLHLKDIFDLLCCVQKAIIYCQFLSATGTRLHQPESFAATPRVISLSSSLRRETWCIIKYVSSGAAQLPYINTHGSCSARQARAFYRACTQPPLCLSLFNSICISLSAQMNCMQIRQMTRVATALDNY